MPSLSRVAFGKRAAFSSFPGGSVVLTLMYSESVWSVSSPSAVQSGAPCARAEPVVVKRSSRSETTMRRMYGPGEGSAYGNSLPRVAQSPRARSYPGPRLYFVIRLPDPDRHTHE